MAKRKMKAKKASRPPMDAEAVQHEPDETSEALEEIISQGGEPINVDDILGRIENATVSEAVVNKVTLPSEKPDVGIEYIPNVSLDDDLRLVMDALSIQTSLDQEFSLTPEMVLLTQVLRRLDRLESLGETEVTVDPPKKIQW